MKILAVTVLSAMAMISTSASSSGKSSESSLKSFDKTFELHGISFRVQCANTGSLNTLVVSPEGLEIDNNPVSFEADGLVTGAEIADLNTDGSPEIYVFVSSAGSGAYGSLAAWSVNNGKSLSEIYLPEIAGDSEIGKGYMGHDEFAVVEQSLVRRFPVYREGDSNAEPSGGMRQIRYSLKAGEAGWKLVPGKVSEF